MCDTRKSLVFYSAQTCPSLTTAGALGHILETLVEYVPACGWEKGAQLQRAITVTPPDSGEPLMGGWRAAGPKYCPPPSFNVKNNPPGHS